MLNRKGGNLMEIFLSRESYYLVKIPPLIWNGFKGIKDSLIANCSDLPHDPTEIKRLNPFSDTIALTASGSG